MSKAPEARREDLLRAAIEVFGDRGIDTATVADIAAAAGVAKGTFYLYFESKEHLLAALRERFVQEALDRAASLYRRVGRDDWWGLVDATVESSIDFMLENRDLIRLMTREGLAPGTEESLAESERRLNWLFASGIQQGIDAGAFRVSDPRLTAMFLHHAIDGTVVQTVLFEDDIDRDRLVACGREMAHKILAPIDPPGLTS